MFFEPRDYLRHILVEAEYLLGHRRAERVGSVRSGQLLAFTHGATIAGPLGDGAGGVSGSTP